MTSQDWQEWHRRYADPESGLSGRLAEVRRRIDIWLDCTAPRQVTVVSACSGDGRDVLGVLAARSDSQRVTARLVERDPGLAERAREAAARLPVDVEVITGDAAASDVYTGSVPADLVLLCGIFGNVPDHDVARTVAAAPQLCAPGAEVVWTRGRHGGRFVSDLTPQIRSWFANAGFAEISWTAPESEGWSVGVHRLVADPVPLRPGESWFEFAS